MATAIKTNLSGSSLGKGIKVVNTGTPGSLIHTATTSVTPAAGGVWDEIWLWAYNSSGSAVTLTIEFGDATAPDHNIVQLLPSLGGLILVVPGLLLQGSATVKAFASTTSVVTISGYVNRISN